jgi:hypothetical protein
MISLIVLQSKLLKELNCLLLCHRSKLASVGVILQRGLGGLSSSLCRFV